MVHKGAMKNAIKVATTPGSCENIIVFRAAGREPEVRRIHRVHVALGGWNPVSHSDGGGGRSFVALSGMSSGRVGLCRSVTLDGLLPVLW